MRPVGPYLSEHVRSCAGRIITNRRSQVDHATNKAKRFPLVTRYSLLATRSAAGFSAVSNPSGTSMRFGRFSPGLPS